MPNQGNPVFNSSGSAKDFWHLGLSSDFVLTGNTTSTGNTNQNLLPLDDDLGSQGVNLDLTPGNHKIIIGSSGVFRIFFNAHEVSQAYYKFYHLFVNGKERRQFHCAGYETLNLNQSAGFWCDIYLHKDDEVQLKASKSANSMSIKSGSSTIPGQGEYTKTRFIGIQIGQNGANQSVKGFFHGASGTDISLAVNVMTKVTDMYEVVPSSGAAFDSVNNKFTINKPGTYLVGQLQTHESGYYRYGVIFKNGVEVFRGHLKSYQAALASNSSYFHELSLLQGDEIEFYYVQTSGSVHTIFMRGKGHTASGMLFPAACVGIRIGE